MLAPADHQTCSRRRTQLSAIPLNPLGVFILLMRLQTSLSCFDPFMS